MAKPARSSATVSMADAGTPSQPAVSGKAPTIATLTVVSGSDAGRDSQSAQAPPCSGERMPRTSPCTIRSSPSATCVSGSRQWSRSSTSDGPPVSRTRAGGVSAGANGLTALAYSAGINGGIGSAGSEASYLALNHSDLSWKGAIGAFAGGGTGRGRQWWRWTCVRHYREELS